MKAIALGEEIGPQPVGLKRMAIPTETRPVILQKGKQRDLQEDRRFRHLMIKLYDDELRAEQIQQLIEQLKNTWPRLATNIAEFRNWLTTIATSGG